MSYTVPLVGIPRDGVVTLTGRRRAGHTIRRRGILSGAGAGLLGATALSGCLETEAPEDSPAAANGDAERTLRLGWIFGQEGPAGESAARFKELVEEQTDGRIHIALAPDSQLGGERDMWEGFELGSIEMAITGDGPVSFFAEEFAALQMFYAFENVEHMYRFLNSDVGEELRQALLERQSGRVLDWWERGPRHLTAGREVLTPEDAEGLRVRDPELPIYAQAWESIGATPVPMAFDELYTALQQGVVDAQENPLELVTTANFDEVQSHVMETAHVYGPYLFAISEVIWQELDDGDQDIIAEAALEAGELERELTVQYEEEFTEELTERGMTFVEVDRDAWAQAVQPAVEALEESGAWREGLYDEIRGLA